MSFEPDNEEHERELEQDNEEQLVILKAILVGIAQITGTSTPEDLIELAKDL